MCGIAGIFHFETNRKVSKDLLKKMADPMVHRGPDGEGYFKYNQIGLAHRRLSIIDLEGGDQPMFNESKDICIVFNGEIYNYIELKSELTKYGHKFRTHSDTEVIIKAYEQWGFDCQKKLNGMWAFAIWDKKARHLFISRDRIGEKPLNYMHYDNSFLFGSEIKSILSYTGDIEPNYEMLQLYLFLGYIPAPFSFYKSVKKLSAGKFLVVKEDNIREYTYWDLPDYKENDLCRDDNKINNELKELLYDSVKIRMRSDVPYGAFLSGGLDSSAIVSYMSKISSHPVKTFTIGFAEKAFDESDKAQIVADYFSTEHNTDIVDKSTLEDSIRKVLFHYDEPFADPAAIPIGYLAKSASSRVKMVLTGDGGDEVFAGYSHYQSEHIASLYKQRLPKFIRKNSPEFIKYISLLLKGNSRYKLNRMERVLRSFNLPFEDRLITKFIKIPPIQLKQLFLDVKTHPIEEFISSTLSKSSLKDPFYLMNYFNLKVSLPEQMLVKVDKMSMAYSIETRAPLIDYRIVELLYGTDKSLKLPNHKNKNVKRLLKNAMANELPCEIIDRRKQGFEVPLREWFKGSDFDNVLKINSKNSKLNSKLIDNLVNENKSAKVDHGTLIWRILLFQRWLGGFNG